jgi:hypothetical protein
MGTARITINGQTYAAPEGADLAMINGAVYINGEKVTDGVGGKSQTKIEIEGIIHHLKADGDVSVNGPVRGNINASGSVQCGAVEGNVDCGGSIHCGNVEGDVDCGGSASCGNVKGNIDAGGSVVCRKD